MCGIVGTYGHDLAEAQFRPMVSALAHRGPDADGVLEDRTGQRVVWLGHRRLSIIDLSSSANQPLVRSNLAITFNGEIYNYRELRAKLIALGARFETQSDTEVVLEGWRMWGARLLPQLRGMFAFAIFDRITGELVLARDPFGIKPLFVLHDPEAGRLAFASELKALTRLPGAALAVDDRAVAALLLYDWIPDDSCIYRGVRKLAPGSLMRVTANGALREEVYWRPEDELGRGLGPATVDEVADALEDSVRAHLVADVPVGMLLSGGLDSSLIAAIAARHEQKLRCFTIGVRAQDQALEAMPDDLRHARVLAQQLGLELHEIEISPDVATLLPRMVEILDEPLGDAAAINVLLLCEASRAAGLKVMLSGMGADEIFGGYRRHRACLIAARFRQLPLVSRSLIGSAVDWLPVAHGGRGLTAVRWAKRFLSVAGHAEEAAYRRSYTYYELDELDALLDHRARGAIDDIARAHADIYWRGGSQLGSEGQLRRMCFTDLQMFLPGLNLAYTDRASMAASVEVRVPFVDRRVVETAFRLGGRDRIRGRVQKYALKRVAERYLSPALVHRPKASFGMPLRAWTTRDLRELIHDVLPAGRLVSSGYINADVLRSMITANERGETDHAQAIWQLLTLEYWFRARA